MGSNHSHGKEINKRNLLYATLLNLIISVIEIIGGIISGSLSLLSDALHNLGDAFSTFIAYIASIVSEKKSTPKRTFGYKRIEILAALLNSVLLIGITIFLFVEAIERLSHPPEIKASLMLVVAVGGLIANVIAVILLHRDSNHNLNVKAAYLHLIGDSLSSLVVIIGGILIYFFDIFWVDPVITFLIGFYLLWQAIKILNETIKILMQNTPASIDIEEIKKFIERDPRIHNIHHIHAWNLTDQKIYFDAHIDTLNDLSLSEVNILRKELELRLNSEFGIHHITLQFEYRTCADDMIKEKD
jgi:cobalt-zinc-cadmium efflux system protein